MTSAWDNGMLYGSIGTCSAKYRTGKKKKKVIFLEVTFVHKIISAAHCSKALFIVSLNSILLKTETAFMIWLYDITAQMNKCNINV